MDTLLQWELIVGFLSATFVLPLVQQPRWSERKRAVVTFAYCLIVGSVTAWLKGGLHAAHDTRSWAAAVLTMLIAAVATYKGFAKPSGVAPAIEHATSPAATPPPAARRRS